MASIAVLLLLWRPTGTTLIAPGHGVSSGPTPVPISGGAVPASSGNLQSTNQNCHDYAVAQGWAFAACQCEVGSSESCKAGYSPALACTDTITNAPTDGSVRTADCAICCPDPFGIGDLVGRAPDPIDYQPGGNGIISEHNGFTLNAPNDLYGAPDERAALGARLEKTFAEALQRYQILFPGARAANHFTINFSWSSNSYLFELSGGSPINVTLLPSLKHEFINFMQHEYGHFLIWTNNNTPFAYGHGEGVATWVAARRWGRADGDWVAFLRDLHRDHGVVFDSQDVDGGNREPSQVYTPVATHHYISLAGFIDYLTKRNGSDVTAILITGGGSYESLFGASREQLVQEWVDTVNAP